MQSVNEFRFSLAWASVGVVLLVACGGCGEKPSMPEAEDRHIGGGETVKPAVLSPAPSTEADALPPPRNVAAEPPSITSPVSAEPLPPIRLAALMSQRDGSVRAGLVDKINGQHALVAIGDVFLGYEVSAADVTKGQVVLERQGKRHVLELERGETAAAWSPSPTGDGSQPLLTAQPALTASPDPSAEMSKMPELVPGMTATTYEATPQEKRLGIDPNEPSTWTPGYRGPAIERVAAKRIPYEPTPEESQRGIDPNEPSSWPEGYRGPGIERLATEAASQLPEGPGESQ